MKAIKANSWTDNVILFCGIFYFASSFLTLAFAGADDYMMLISVVIAAFFTALQTRGRIKISLDAFHIMTLLFLAYCYLSCLWAVDAEVTQDATRIVALTLVLLYILYIYYRRKPIDTLLMTVMLGGYAVCILLLYEQGLNTYLRAIVLGMRVYDYNYINANTMGMLSASSILINIYYILYQKKIKWWSIGSIPAFICMAGAGSKKSLILLLGGFVMLLLLYNYNDKKKFVSILKIVIAVTIGSALVYVILSRTELFSGILDRFEGLIAFLTGKGVVDWSTKERSDFLKVGVEIFKNYPIFGCGINCPRVLNSVRGTYLHNNYIELLAGGGIVGFLCYYVMYIYVLYEMWKYRAFRTAEYDICLVLLILHIVLEMAYVSYFNKETYFYFMINFLEVRQLKNQKGIQLRYIKECQIC